MLLAIPHVVYLLIVLEIVLDFRIFLFFAAFQ
jgi:hypothetical protein